MEIDLSFPALALVATQDTAGILSEHLEHWSPLQ